MSIPMAMNQYNSLGGASGHNMPRRSIVLHGSRVMGRHDLKHGGGNLELCARVDIGISVSLPSIIEQMRL